MQAESRNPLVRYMHWLHTRWPAGTVERLPEIRSDFSTRVPGVYIVGDLTGRSPPMPASRRRASRGRARSTSW